MIQSISSAAAAVDTAQIRPAANGGRRPEPGQADETRPQFMAIMGEMLFGQMLKSMRKTVDKPAYFHGGRTEEVFTQQLDQVLAKKLGESSGDSFLGPMYDLWTLNRK